MRCVSTRRPADGTLPTVIDSDILTRKIGLWFHNISIMINVITVITENAEQPADFPFSARTGHFVETFKSFTIWPATPSSNKMPYKF